MMPRIYAQPVYGAPSDREYRRLQLPKRMTETYVGECGDRRYVAVASPDTLIIGGPDIGETPIHILRVRRRRGVVFQGFYQVMFPQMLAKHMEAGDTVEVARDGDVLRLRFHRDLFPTSA